MNKPRIILALTGLFLLALVVITQDEAISAAVRWLAYVAAAGGTVAVAIGLVAWGWWAWEHGRTVSAKRRIIERDAQVMVVTAGEAIYVRDVDLDAKWWKPHLDPRVHSNGRASEPTPIEYAAWRAWLERIPGKKSFSPVSTRQPDYPTIESRIVESSVELPDRVDLFDLMPNPKGDLRRIYLGVRVENDRLSNVVAPIWQLVHVANAGATDSGKSNLSRVIAYQCLTAHNARTVFVDLKRQTFKTFQGTGNMLYPIVTDIQDFIAVLDMLHEETETRLQLFEPHLTVETIHDYNKLVDQPLHYITVFVDEISNIFMNKEAQQRFLALIRISRAVGVYFIAAGQTWSHRTLSPDIRQQFRTGFHFGTNDANSSRMILNDKRAIDIQQQGRAYVALPFGLASSVIEVQTPYLPLSEVVNRTSYSVRALESIPSPIPKQNQADLEDNFFIQLVQEGKSRREASMKAYGREYAGNIVSRAKRVLGEL